MNLFIPCAPIAEIMLFKDIGFLEKAHCPVDGRDRYPRIKARGPAIHLINIRVIVRLGQHARNGTSLIRQLQPLINA